MHSQTACHQRRESRIQLHRRSYRKCCLHPRRALARMNVSIQTDDPLFQKEHVPISLAMLNKKTAIRPKVVTMQFFMHMIFCICFELFSTHFYGLGLHFGHLFCSTGVHVAMQNNEVDGTQMLQARLRQKAIVTYCLMNSGRSLPQKKGRLWFNWRTYWQAMTVWKHINRCKCFRHRSILQVRPARLRLSLRLFSSDNFLNILSLDRWCTLSDENLWKRDQTKNHHRKNTYS